ncbi:3-isopropylmalate dehydratase [Pelomyxa schiedti]|nr:3-isopropylmalate dehydratase [Pelomyxa schiedti]
MSATTSSATSTTITPPATTTTKTSTLRSSGLIARPHACTFDKWFGPNKNVRLREFGDLSAIAKAPIIPGFPSVSLTSILTAGYLAEQLELPLIGVISSPLFPPRCVLDRGRPCHPIRIFGDARLVVIMCEFKLEPPELAAAVCEAMFDFSARHQSSMIITVEGDPSKKPTDDDGFAIQNLLFVSTSSIFTAKMSEVGHQPLENGLISGMTGLILAEGPLCDVEVACLLCPCNPMYPEAYSAVAVVNAIAHFLTDIRIDTSQLEQKARTLQQQVTNLLKAESMSKRPAPSSFMYA